MKLVIISLCLLSLGILSNVRSQAPALDTFVEMYNECLNKTSGCFGMPSKCIDKYAEQVEEKSKGGKDIDPHALCGVFVSWKKEGDGYKYRMAAIAFPNSAYYTDTRGAYIAVALSYDDLMGNDSAVACVRTKWNAEAPTPIPVVVGRYFTYREVRDKTKEKKIISKQRAVPVSAPASAHEGHFGNLPFDLGIENAQPSVVDGHIFCEFVQKSHTIGKSVYKLEDHAHYHLLLARGHVEFNDSSAGGTFKYFVDKHDNQLVSEGFNHSVTGQIRKARPHHNSTSALILDIYAIIFGLILVILNH